MCLCTLCGVQAQTIYRVTSESEFLAALGNNRTVTIASGVHLNLSRVLENEEMFLNKPGRRWASIASDIISKQPFRCRRYGSDALYRRKDG